MPEEKITIHYNSSPIYDIILSESFDSLAETAGRLDIAERKVCIVSDSNVAPLYSLKIKKIFESICKKVCCFQFPAGEERKNLDTVQDLYEFLINEHFERKDVLAALGGGVVGDLTGFASASYLRGIRFIQIPTSLLAQVDSSIGGKTGVDFRAYKNMVGAFHQPSLVYSNAGTLSTLSESQYISGMGEIVKHGLIKDKRYYYWLKEKKDEILNRDLSVLTIMIKHSDEIKQKVVENDPFEQGERALLNFGHTIGHAVEKLKNFTMLHGECVSVGIAAASFLSMSLKMISERDYLDIIDTLKSFGLPVDVAGIEDREILKVSKSDKKMDHGRVKFILLDGIGNAVINTEITDDQILEAVRSVIK